MPMNKYGEIIRKSSPPPPIPSPGNRNDQDTNKSGIWILLALFVFAVIVLSLWWVLTSHKRYDFPDGTLSYNGHHYYVYEDIRSDWDQAMSQCENRGGYLAVINDSKENEELFRYIKRMGYELVVFGCTDQNREGSWRYLQGDDSSFTDWGKNSKGVQEPNDADDGEDHAALDVYMRDGHWNDVQFGRQAYTADGARYRNKYAYLCEWDF